jgi:hypothetical protein
MKKKSERESESREVREKEREGGRGRKIERSGDEK